MQSNPFVAGVRILVTAALACLVLLVFWQSNHMEDQLRELTKSTSQLSENVRELERKVGQGGGGGGAAIAAQAKTWGWSLNAGFDAAPDPTKPVGTPGRYK